MAIDGFQAGRARNLSLFNVTASNRVVAWKGELELVLAMRLRYEGCLLGLAAGDALGTTVEFKVPG
ncbi:MAG: ADP-ribosylglycohydrolase family protein, partial [Candidatus Competibacteraceae bacterium]|nr:ADP-ribosylglycohydrolase family protein [Candidatus Competibacteraceae bacterium]